MEGDVTILLEKQGSDDTVSIYRDDVCLPIEMRVDSGERGDRLHTLGPLACTTWRYISGSLLLALVAGCDVGQEPQSPAREPYDEVTQKFFELDSELERLKKLESTGKMTDATFTVTKRDYPEVRMRREWNKEFPMTVVTVTEALNYTVDGKRYGYESNSERFREFVGPTPQSVTLPVVVIYLPDDPQEYFVGDRDDLEARIADITKELEDL